MTADVGQSGGGGVLPLGDGPYHDIPVRDNAADLLMLDDNHIANIRVPHGTGGLVHRRGAGQRHGVRRHHLTNLLHHVILLLLEPLLPLDAWESCLLASPLPPVRRVRAGAPERGTPQPGTCSALKMSESTRKMSECP